MYDVAARVRCMEMAVGGNYFYDAHRKDATIKTHTTRYGSIRNQSYPSLPKNVVDFIAKPSIIAHFFLLYVTVDGNEYYTDEFKLRLICLGMAKKLYPANIYNLTNPISVTMLLNDAKKIRAYIKEKTRRLVGSNQDPAVGFYHPYNDGVNFDGTGGIEPYEGVDPHSSACFD